MRARPSAALWIGTVVAMLWSCSGEADRAAPDDAAVAAEDGGEAPSSEAKAGSGRAGRASSAAGTSSASAADDDAGNTSQTGARDDADSGTPAQDAETTGVSMSSVMALPSDGNQFALCAMAQGECNKGFACRAPASARSAGRGFCSMLCESDADCADASTDHAQAICSPSGAVRTCDLVCDGEDDSESCPAQMRCVQTAALRAGRGPGDAGAAQAEFRCRFPFDESASWQRCADGLHACADGLVCHSGRCVQACESDDDCSDKPSSGSITPSCANVSAARGAGAEQKLCVLDCSSAAEGCPEDTRCVEAPTRGRGNGAAPAYSRCE